MNILLTGGTGYIGSHTAVALVESGHKVVLLDNLCNSQDSVLEKLHVITGQDVPFVRGDIRDTALLSNTLQKNSIDAVIHFAGLKAVGESVKDPIGYFDNNVGGTISLLRAMCASKVKTLVFSSSATVYGVPQYLPLDEGHPTHAINPYGRSKLHIEEILTDVMNSDPGWRIACLRYFNPVGAHSSGLIGEDPNDVPNNLMPYIARVASGKLPHLNVYGNDYATKDGTGVRDYIHVMDLAEGHIAALNFLKRRSELSFDRIDAATELRSDEIKNCPYVVNLGTGQGYSVLDMVQEFEFACGQSIPCNIISRRAGDIGTCYANVEKAFRDLQWSAQRTLKNMCASAWKFQINQNIKHDGTINIKADVSGSPDDPEFSKKLDKVFKSAEFQQYLYKAVTDQAQTSNGKTISLKVAK